VSYPAVIIFKTVTLMKLIQIA